MSSLLSVGIDIGTTTTHLVISRLHFANVSAFRQAPRLVIHEREVVYRGGIHFTPLTDGGVIDQTRIGALIEAEYQAAGIGPNQIDVGALIVTGESAKKRNAESVARALVDFAGEFVTANAGPNLESILAARGCGAFSLSKNENKTILSADIGGGTVNVAVIRAGTLIDTACLELGGRFFSFDSAGSMKGVTESAKRFFGEDRIRRLRDRENLFRDELVMCATDAAQLTFDFLSGSRPIPANVMLTDPLRHDYEVDQFVLTGGVAELMQAKDLRARLSGENPSDWLPYHDMGLLLAEHLDTKFRQAGLSYTVAPDAIRSTVIGAGMHTLQLTGSTIESDHSELPFKNVPLIKVGSLNSNSASILAAVSRHDVEWQQDRVALYVESVNGESGEKSVRYEQLKRFGAELAEAIKRGQACEPHIIVLSDDVGAALGMLLRKELGARKIIAIDGVDAEEGDFIDIGKPILHSQQGAATIALPVVIKSLVFGK